MRRTFTEKAGMIQSVLAAAQAPDLQSQLTSRGLHLDPLIERLSTRFEQVSALTAECQSLRSLLRRKKEQLSKEVIAADMQASGLIDTMCGVLGKTTRAAHDLRKIRSRIRVPRAADEPSLRVVQAKAA